MCINIRCRYGRGRGGKQLIYFSSGSIQSFEMNELDSPIHLFNRNSTIRWESKGPGPKGPETKAFLAQAPLTISSGHYGSGPFGLRPLWSGPFDSGPFDSGPFDSDYILKYRYTFFKYFIVVSRWEHNSKKINIQHFMSLFRQKHMFSPSCI